MLLIAPTTEELPTMLAFLPLNTRPSKFPTLLAHLFQSPPYYKCLFWTLRTFTSCGVIEFLFFCFLRQAINMKVMLFTPALVTLTLLSPSFADVTRFYCFSPLVFWLLNFGAFLKSVRASCLLSQIFRNSFGTIYFLFNKLFLFLLRFHLFSWRR